jgi:hydrogenase maturation protease
MIDAVKTDATPGTVHFFSPGHFRQTVNAFSFHDINILDAMKVGNKIGIPLPSRLDIIAVEIAEDRIFSERMSPELEEAFPAICLTVEEWMNSNLVNK